MRSLIDRVMYGRIVTNVAPRMAPLIQPIPPRMIMTMKLIARSNEKVSHDTLRL